MSRQQLATPLPILDGPHQSGIADPIWSTQAPRGVDAEVYAEVYAGQVERQRHLHIVLADVLAETQTDLRAALATLSGFARHQMRKTPPPLRPLDPPPANRRVSVTIGLGATLFTTRNGDDRFGLAGLKPRALKIMPRFAGDDVGFKPADQATDLVVLIASDDYYVNEYIVGRLLYRNVTPQVVVRRLERGYARPDSREPSGFEDGITNPKNLDPRHKLDHFVFVHPGDAEPTWCAHGTYMGYRKIRRRMGAFFQLKPAAQEAIFGVRKNSGKRRPDAPRDAHAQKMNPRRREPDFTGTHDDARHIYRRPYFFDDGLDAQGEEVRGLHHISFARNLVTQYEWPVVMWQTNKDFPKPNSGMDALYERGGAANIGGGYYFMPGAGRDFVGEGLFG